MKIEITKLQKVEVPSEFQKEEGCVAFQSVKVKINNYFNRLKAV